ncbi:phage protease [Lonepinella sp. BR2474]|uniref:phage protease n=1 Tax=Lonepinella sp. BR2474 TaxID=3434548 RepID=UPI003F6DCE64
MRSSLWAFGAGVCCEYGRHCEEMDCVEKLKLAVAGFELQQGQHGRIQLLPYGEFRAVDGRPTDVKAWIVADSNGQDVVDLANGQQNPLPIDYEHQILHSKTNGKEAPSAGWMEYLYFTPQGIFADVRWTDKAAEYIRLGEYRYISAVFAYDTEGFVRKIFHAALTNFPALDGMDEAIVMASSGFDLSTTKEMKPMDKELLTALCALFGREGATEAEIKAEVLALAESKGESAVALSQVYAVLQAKEQKVASLTAEMGKVDPAKFVPVDQVVALQADLNALKAEREGEKKAQLIQAALSQGKLAPALTDWANSLSVADLSAYLDKAPAIAALSGDTQAKTDPNVNQVALSAEEVAAAKMLGMSAAEFIQQHKQ